ncbi:hypothetical protein BDQ17DRAFT_1429858 [Cyathus striatus]|nr:hypothetical protein BDQ17DRAFT_1429858 [Cyathus striatus]
MFSEHQNEAIASAKALLLSVRLNPNLDDITLLDDSPESTAFDSSTTPPPLPGCTPSVTDAEPIGAFTTATCTFHLGVPTSTHVESHPVATDVYIHRQLIIDYLIDHPLGEIVEYPEAVVLPQGIIGHHFTVDPANYCDPKLNIQYSLGTLCGTIDDVHCGTLLCDNENQSVLCKNDKETCKGLKVCKRYSEESENICPHEPSAEEIVFNKTLLFYCAMKETGCSFDSININDYCGDCDSDDDSDVLEEDPSGRMLFPSGSLCSGRMIFSYDKYDQPCLQCEFWTGLDKAH